MLTRCTTPCTFEHLASSRWSESHCGTDLVPGVTGVEAMCQQAHTFFSAFNRLAWILLMAFSASFSARQSSFRSSLSALRFVSRLLCSSSFSSRLPSSCLSCCSLSPISCKHLCFDVSTAQLDEVQELCGQLLDSQRLSRPILQLQIRQLTGGNKICFSQWSGHSSPGRGP